MPQTTPAPTAPDGGQPAGPPRDALTPGQGSEPRPESSVSPMLTGARLSWALLAVFAVTYFGTAILTSAAFRDVAALRVAGAPLAVLLGFVVLVVGLAVTRTHLVRGEH